MKKRALYTITFLIMSINIYAEEHTAALSRQVTDTNATRSPVKVKTVRSVLGKNNPIEHQIGQLRAGYITFKENGSDQTSAYALGGHYHIDSKRYKGLKAGLSAYTVLNAGIRQNPLHVNQDFFDGEGHSFITLSEAYLDGKWGDTEIKLGRQILDTPHADSDDIRMMPNYFTAYTVTNSDVPDLTLSAGWITKMAGWENGVDASRFVKLSKTLESPENTKGVFYASAAYEGIKDLSLSVWYYRYDDIADVLYAEAGYETKISDTWRATFGLQYDASRQTGAALLGVQDATTFGISTEFANEKAGIHLLAAYNRDSGDTGAFGLSLGGGPLFTSMEDQTLDVIGSAGEAWMIGAGYHFEAIGIDGLTAGLAYGHFQAKEAALYTSSETDAVLEYSMNEKFTLTLAYASVRFDAGSDENGDPLADYEQIRMIANYHF